MRRSDAALREAADRVTTHSAFARSKRLRSLLDFLVDQCAAADGEAVDAARIAREVLGRGEDFDARRSSIVRTEMARLRRALERAYADPVLADAPRVTLPLGGYEPRLEHPVEPDPPAADRGIDGPGVAILALPCFASPSLRALAGGLHHELLHAFSRFDDVRVCDGAGVELLSRGEQLAFARQRRCQFVISGSLDGSERTPVAVLTVVDPTSGRLVWSQRSEAGDGARSLLAFQDDVAATVVRDLLSATGRLRMIEFERWHVPDESWDVWDLINRWHYYRAEGRSRELHARITQSLATLLDANPHWVQGWLVKGFMRLDEYLFRFSEVTQAEVRADLDDVCATVRGLKSDSAQGAYLGALRERFVGVASRFPDAMEAVLALNPHRLELLHHGGTLIAFGGDWARGSALVRRAALHHNNSISYRNFYAVDALREDENERAVELVRSAAFTPASYVAELWLAIAAARLGRMEEAIACYEKACAAAPSLRGDLATEMQRWFLDSPLGRDFLATLRTVEAAARA